MAFGQVGEKNYDQEC